MNFQNLTWALHAHGCFGKARRFIWIVLGIRKGRPAMMANPGLDMRRAALSLFITALRVTALAILLIASAVAQQSPNVLDPNAITGFESLGTWQVTGNSSPPGFLASVTTNRTQGNAAYSVANPPNLVKLISQPIASTATALQGIGNSGALLQMDILLPVQQGNKVNSGYIQPYLTSPSRGLSKVPLAQVFFNSYREGIYTTLGFAIPNAVRSALGAATFNDLTVELDISSPGKMTGAYLIDNLRVHSVALIQSPTGMPPPPGYGGSVNLVLYGDGAIEQSFDLA